MKTRRRLEQTLIFFCGLTIGLLLSRFADDRCVDVVKTKYIKGDDIPHYVYRNVPTPYKVEVRDTLIEKDTLIIEGDTQYIIQVVDTAAILKDYLSIIEYRDTVKNDSSALIVLNENVFMNRIQHRDVLFQNRKSTVINTVMNDGIVLGVGGTLSGLMASAGYRAGRNTFNVTYSSDGVGLNYQYQIYGKD